MPYVQIDDGSPGGRWDWQEGTERDVWTSPGGIQADWKSTLGGIVGGIGGFLTGGVGGAITGYKTGTAITKGGGGGGGGLAMPFPVQGPDGRLLPGFGGGRTASGRRRRRMNPANIRALRRSVTRVKAAEKMFRRIFSVSHAGHTHKFLPKRSKR